MPKMLGNSSGKNDKSCRVLLQESNKISFVFFWIVYDFLRNLQESVKHKYYLRFTFATRPLTVLIPHKDTLGSRKTPREEGGRHNWVLGPWGRPLRPKFGEPAARVAGERAGRWPWTHHVSVWGRKRGGDGVGELARRHQAAAAAVARAPARWRLRGESEQAGELWQVQEEVETALVGYAAGRAREFAAAASMVGRGRSTGAEARPGARWRRAALSSDGRLASGLRMDNAPWYGGLRMARTGRQRVDRWSGAARMGTAWSTRRLGTRDVGKARGGLGKARVGRGRRGGGRGAGALWLQRFSVPLFDRVFLKISQLKCTEW
jgi:hypothetical protein